jgi:quercetin dioxygenase-like cupin family protein
MDKKPRTFVRELTSETYGLKHFRQAQLDVPRVRDDTVVTAIGKGAGYSSDEGDGAEVHWRVAPGDDDFLTQTIQVHLVKLPPHGQNQGHGHQNEAAFYIIDGAGYEIHDDQRYDWQAGDLVFVHTDSVHQHFNPYDEPALIIVFKAKSTWMFLGLLQQGRGGPIARPDDFGERVDWSQIWTDGVLDRKKVVTPADTRWESTPLGRTRVLNSLDQLDHRQFGVDVFELEIPAGSRSARHWKMADEVLYVLDGSGYSLHWEVQEEIAEKYYARIANEPTRHEFTRGDLLYVPQNTVAQHFAADGSPLRLLSAQNRVFKHLGYDNVHYFEDAPASD